MVCVSYNNCHQPQMYILVWKWLTSCNKVTSKRRKLSMSTGSLPFWSMKAVIRSQKLVGMEPTAGYRTCCDCCTAQGQRTMWLSCVRGFDCVNAFVPCIFTGPSRQAESVSPKSLYWWRTIHLTLANSDWQKVVRDRIINAMLSVWRTVIVIDSWS